MKARGVSGKNDAKSRKKQKKSIFHNRQANSLIPPDQKVTKRSPSKFGKHVSFTEKPQKTKQCETNFRNFFEPFFSKITISCPSNQNFV